MVVHIVFRMARSMRIMQEQSNFQCMLLATSERTHPLICVGNSPCWMSSSQLDTNARALENRQSLIPPGLRHRLGNGTTATHVCCGIPGHIRGPLSGRCKDPKEHSEGPPAVGRAGSQKRQRHLFRGKQSWCPTRQIMISGIQMRYSPLLYCNSAKIPDML